MYFLGYRIPESDAAARRMLLNAIYRPTRLNPFKNLEEMGRAAKAPFVEIVLGARPHHDRDRLRSLLEMVGAEVRDRGLYAQDVLEAWNPSEETSTPSS